VTSSSIHNLARPYKVYILILLMIGMVISYVDRQVLTILLEPIRKDLGFSDTQMGLIAGVFFSAFYVVASIPLARMSDRGSRKGMIAACMAAWSLATALCGAVHNFAQLAIARMFVAVGEAGGAPAIYSILADLFPPHLRGRIFALVSCGTATGIALGLYLGGFLNDLFGWRMVFVIVGIPGLIFAGLVLFTVPETGRAPVAAGVTPLSTSAALRRLWGLSTFRWVTLLTVLAAATAFAVMAWMPTFMIRVHGMSTADIGLQMGAMTIFGPLGHLSAGALADRLGRRDARWIVWVPALGLAACVPVGWLMLFAPGAGLAIIAFGAFNYVLGFWGPLAMTTVVGLASPDSKALAASIVPALQSVGGAIGPLFVGMLNDGLATRFGTGSVRYSIALALLGCGLAAVCAIFAARRIRTEYLAEQA
jgi:predicted MFS family arabinose efflux permease